MGSFAMNMYHHITLETKGAAVYLTVKESYTHVPRKKNISKPRTKFQSANSRKLKIPGAFSQMSQCGTSEGSASPTLTCLLASLLHKWTYKSSITKTM